MSGLGLTLCLPLESIWKRMCQADTKQPPSTAMCCPLCLSLSGPQGKLHSPGTLCSPNIHTKVLVSLAWTTPTEGFTLETETQTT